MRILKILVVSVLFFSSPLPVRAQQPDEPLVKIRLVPESGWIKPGGDQWIAIEQTITPGWHTYWKNPGDSGVPPRVEWDMPSGFKMGEINWPTPHKLPYGPLLNYGYSDRAVLLQKLTVPDHLAQGPVTIKAKIDVLVCKEECIPETGIYTLTLNDEAGGTKDNGAFIKDAVAHMPKDVPWTAQHAESGKLFQMRIMHADIAGQTKDISLFPGEWGVVDTNAAAHLERDGDDWVLTQARGDRPLSEAKSFDAVLVTGEGDHAKAYHFTTKPDETALSSSKNSVARDATDVVDAPDDATSFGSALVLALLGGMILNLMPCVFPVLSIKALSLVEAVNKDRRRVRLHGVSYTAGILISFLALAGLLIALKATGAQIGWGFQLQNMLVIGALIYLFVVIGLSLLGLFEVSGRFTNFGSHFTRGEGYQHSFFTGVLATLVATPCTAPFMGVAIGYALLQGPFISLCIFTALGFGLALPYLALSFVPALQKILPYPGHWMNIFRQLLAFPMFASAAWLVWVLAQQAGEMAVLQILLGALLLAFAVWTHRQMTLTRFRSVLKKVVIVLSIIGAIWLMPWANHAETEEGFGLPYSSETLGEALDGADPVFVEMTAAWCITCKFNHAVAINTESTRKVFTTAHVQYLVGDWTNSDPAITAYLKKFGRSGVPLYVYYGPAADAQAGRPEPVILPQILTPGMVGETITR